MEDLIDFEDGEDRKVNYTHKDHDYVLQSHDPYGFWTVSKKKGGNTPQEISGLYTALSETKKAIQEYHTLQEFKEANAKKHIKTVGNHSATV